MPNQSLSAPHLNALHTAHDVFELFRLLGYPVDVVDPFEGADLDTFDLDPVDRANIKRAYIVARLNTHTIYLYEAEDLRAARLRSLAWHVLQRGTGLLIVTTPAYREIVFADPRSAGRAIKSAVRVNKLKVITAEPTRHDLDTLNAIHAYRRTAQQVYEAQGTAFNVTTVTKRFYDDYHAHYERAKAAIKAANPGVRDFYDADKLHAFTQRLLGRLMFLYFLQRKGWLGERPRFLTDQFMLMQRRHAGETHGGETYYYYSDVLEPLFFDTLNTKRPGDITIWEGVRIPYLNGGLFDDGRDPQELIGGKSSRLRILIPDSLFDPNDVNGLLGFFNRYNFTITDDTPLEQDVAVDPEMLGKVFENLLEERDRGQSGSFYTPRPIVSYMCQESLAGYLEESAGIPRETTRASFDPDQQVTLTAEQAARINAALDTVTVLDPAVGSGSFLIGMMNEIIRLRRLCYAVLNPRAPEADTKTVTGWKEAIIRDTLYGVDIKPEAIEIAQLRMWLALVVDQPLTAASPLPNLDYKLMAGNSLIETIDGEPVLGELATRILSAGDDAAVQWESVRDQLQMFDPNPTQGRMLLFDEEKQAHKERIKLDEMRREYFSASPERRKQLKPEIMAQERQIVAASLRERADKYQQQVDEYGRKAALANGVLKAADQRKLTTAVDHLKRLSDVQTAMGKPDAALPFFLYRMHCSEVFERKGGFDVVIANPPYVRMELIKDQKEEFERVYSDVYAGRADLYVYFYARGYQLLRQRGQFAYISSNKFMRAKYGERLRGFLTSKMCLQTLVDFGDLPVFDAAAYPCIVIAEKQTLPQSNIRAAAVKDIAALENLPQTLEHGLSLSQKTLGENEWQIVDADTERVIHKLKLNSVTLNEFVKSQFFMGVKSGLNEAFVIDAATREQLISEDQNSAEIIKPFIIGRDVKRWTVDKSDRYIIFTQHGIDIARFPAVETYLLAFKERLEVRATSANHAWYELQQPQMGIYPEFDKAKIVYPEFGIKPEFGYDTKGLYINNKLFTIPGENFFLLGVLNSNVSHFFLRLIGSQIQGGFIEFRWMTLAKLPIPNPPAELRERIAAAARACLDAAQSSPERLPALEKELNRLVYQAYGLDDEDVRVIEGAVGGKSASAEANELSGDNDAS